MNSPLSWEWVLQGEHSPHPLFWGAQKDVVGNVSLKKEMCPCSLLTKVNHFKEKKKKKKIKMNVNLLHRVGWSVVEYFGGCK
jgi:hypothetical protein